MKKDPLVHYLQRYAEPEALTIAESIPKTLAFKRCIAIPAYNESTGFLSRLYQQTTLVQNTLIILIINQPENCHTSQRNQTLWGYGLSTGNTLFENENACLIHWSENKGYLLMIDRFSGARCIPTSQGVGLARKIACDIACALIHKGLLQDQWIFNTDADALLPENYFNSVFLNDELSAIVFRYHHVGPTDDKNHSHSNDDIYRATHIVEQSLYYYVEGLHYANSPYAYHSLGSCIAVNAHYYGHVRGFPKRSGGEDFYLLNKLKKLAPIASDSNICLHLLSRLSSRVPFGTGPAVAHILDAQLDEADYPYYHPQLFVALKKLLEHFTVLANKSIDGKSWLALLPEDTQQSLLSMHINKLFTHLEKPSTQTNKQRLNAIHHWFDAFKTLKFFHTMEKMNPEHYGKMCLTEAKRKLEVLKNEN